MADAAEMVEVAPMHSTGHSTGSINSLDAHRNDKAGMELIVTLHGHHAATLDAGDDRWLHARTTSMGAMSARFCSTPGGPRRRSRRDLSCECPL